MSIGINLKDEEVKKSKKLDVVESSSLEEKQKRFLELQKKMEKDFGKGSIIGATDRPKHYDCISSGSIGLGRCRFIQT